jgi:sensor domain CHASE-containing protein
LEQNLKHLISFLPVFNGPKRHSRFDGVHIFQNDALASAKRSFSVSQPPFFSERRSRLDGVHILHVHGSRFSS